MTYLEVLEKWAIYSEYDREQTSFNLLSKNYALHKVGKYIEMLLSEYDPSGMLAVIYAKMQFKTLLQGAKITVWDVLTDPECLKKEKEMYEVFNISVITEAENDFIDRLNQIYIKITEGKLIGEDNREQLLNSIETVVESIKKCNVDLFLKGGKIHDVRNISTRLHIFNTLAECLLAMERAQDGMYFCFIKAGNSADCFFAFFIKSNGTILSVNDRIDEAYIGQHGNARNGRWTEGKADGIFPYDFIFQYSEHDYKGYATKYEINEEKLDLYNLGIEVFMPIVISMLLIILKYSDKDIEMPIHYLDSFLPESRGKIESHELMVIGESNLACGHNAVDLFFDNQKILSGGYAEEFKWENGKNYKETGSFSNNNQFMVDLWGDGFVFDESAVFANNNVTCLMDKHAYVPEFVGTEKRLRLQVYKEARLQLANYMNNRIYEAWVAFGKTQAVKEWYRAALLNNKEFLYRMMMDYEAALGSGEKKAITMGCRRLGEINIYIIRDSIYPDGAMLSREDLFGCKRIGREWKWISDVNGCTCNLWFVIAPQTWKDLEYLTGTEVPKIVKGWNIDGHSYSGNPLLSSCDPVESVKTPFEYEKYNREDRWVNSYYPFKFAFGFSKSGWNQIKKELKKDEKNKD